jgi:hypothetical protein
MLENIITGVILSVLTAVGILVTSNTPKIGRLITQACLAVTFFTYIGFHIKYASEADAFDISIELAKKPFYRSRYLLDGVNVDSLAVEDPSFKGLNNATQPDSVYRAIAISYNEQNARLNLIERINNEKEKKKEFNKLAGIYCYVSFAVFGTLLLFSYVLEGFREKRGNKANSHK